MLSYRGTYRVSMEIAKSGNPEEFSFIPCRIAKGSNIRRHNENTLNAYITSVKTGNRLLREYPDLFSKHHVGDKEIILLFSETQIEQVAKILKAMVLGKNVSPRAKRNIRLNRR